MLGLGASLALHLVLGVALLGLARPPRSPREPDDTVEVTIIAVPSRRPEPPAPPKSSSPSPKTQVPTSPPDDMMHVATMLSGAALADPKSRKARAELETLDADERMIQLCSIEAMAQVASARRDLRPDSIVAYARSEPVIGARSISANGAVLHGKGGWYQLAFQCDLSADQRFPAVVGFAFRLGEAIPRRDWRRLNLPEAAAAAD